MAPRPQTPEANPQETTPAPAPSRPWSLLAQEAFGENFHGEVSQEPREPNQVTGEQPAGDAGEGEGEPPPQDAQPDEGEGEAPTEPAAEGLPAEGEGEAEGEIRSAKELVDHLEADPEWFSGLEVDVTVDGQTSQVPLRDLVANYQMNQAADQRLETAKTQAAQAQEEISRKTAALETQYATAARMIEEADQLIMAEMAEIDWDQLRQDDPAEWSARRLQFEERQKKVQQAKDGLVTQYQQTMTERQQEMLAKRGEYLQEQSELLASSMPKISPDWGDPKKVDTAKGRLGAYLLTQGFSEQDIQTAADHRLLLVAEKARLYDEARGRVDVSKKRISKVPKAMRPGAKPEASVINLQEQQKLRSSLRQSGSMDDAVALIRAKRKG